MAIEIIDLKKRFQEEKYEILKCINRVLKKGNFILTPEVQNFEKSICKFTGSKYCLGVNSGTDALMMSLWSAGIKKGDEIITSPISFIASASSIIHVGARPVFVDVDDDLNINPNLIESAITKKTKAIMPIHWTGRVCDMDKILKIAKKHNLIIVEDAPKPVMMPSPCPAGTEKHPYSILRFALRENSPYPIPMVSQALDVQKELNLARSRIMTHRKRFNRKYGFSL